MGETTGISWTDHTFNPWHGCWKIAPECKNCYAEMTANRYSPGMWGRTAPRRFMSDQYWSQLAKWNRKAERDGVRRRVFIGSMCDWAEVHPDPTTAAKMNEERSRMWREIAACQSLDFLLLTKRIDDAADMLPWVASKADWASVGVVAEREQIGPAWSNVWIGVTAGTVESMIKSVPALRTTPAAVRFISCEPILEEIPDHVWDKALDSRVAEVRADRLIHRLIVGDESGHHARHVSVDAIRGARDAAKRNGVRLHFKQWANPEVPPGIANPVTGERKGRKIHLPILDGVQHAEFPRTR